MWKIQIKKAVSVVLFLSLLSAVSLGQGGIISATTPDAAAADAVWKALSVFEGSYKSVTSDFDCQGMSIGVAQWNIGKSFESVKKIILANSPTVTNQIMRKHGSNLVQAINGGKETTLDYVRNLQTIQAPLSCDSNVRQAVWNVNGKVFASELGKLLSTNESLKAQRELRYNIFIDGWRNANKWAVAYRGENSIPTMREIAYFVDMQIFSGGGLEKFEIKYEKISADKVTALSEEAIDYLRTADNAFLLHKIAARKNANLLKPTKLSESDAALFVNAYLISNCHINAPHAKQFRLTIINRRSAILFGAAFYSDKDAVPTKIFLP